VCAGERFLQSACFTQIFCFPSLFVAETNILGSRETADLYEQRKRRTFVGRETAADLYERETSAELCEQGNGESL
jgi:hypothetical protein